MLSDARESTNRVKKRCHIKEFFSELVVFLVRKGSYTYTTLNIVKIRKICERKKGEIRKTWSMTKKRSSAILAAKMEIVSEKAVIQKSWSAKNVIPSSQTRRQVSATAPKAFYL